MDTKEIEQLKKFSLEVNGHQHNLGLMLARAGSCPLIDAELKDIDLETFFETEPLNRGIGDMTVVLYKFNGKLLVLTGFTHVLEAVAANKLKIQARLITSVALKAARIVKDQPEVPAVVPFNPPRFTSDKPWENKPSQDRRDTERRPFTASAGPSHERRSIGEHLADKTSRPQHSSPKPRTLADRVVDQRQTLNKPISAHPKSLGEGAPRLPSKPEHRQPFGKPPTKKFGT